MLSGVDLEAIWGVFGVDFEVIWANFHVIVGDWPLTRIVYVKTVLETGFRSKNLSGICFLKTFLIFVRVRGFWNLTWIFEL